MGYWQTLSARLKRLRVRRLPAATLGHLQGQRAAILRLLDEAQAAYVRKVA